MRAPLTSISIIPRRAWPGGDAISSGIVCAGARRSGSPAVAGPPSEAIRTGTKPWRLDACRRRQLVSPHREQPTDNAIAARDLGNVGAFLEALRYDPGLLLRRPPSPPALPGDHLDTTIGIAFLPGIKHGICHRLHLPTISSCQAVSQINRATARWGPHAGYDRERLPEKLSKAFARIVAARFRLRGGGVDDDQEVVALIAEMQRLAFTNEVLVAVSPDRDDRAAAAFVAGSAHQLCFNARRIGAEDEASGTYIDANAVSSDVAAMLLFLVAEATADASEIASRLNSDGVSPVERTLIEALRSLARGELVGITSATLPSKDVVTGDTAAEVAALALYYKILLGVRALANQLLRGDDDEASQASEMFRSVLRLSSAARPDGGGWLGGEVGSFAGPHHLASLLLAVSGDLSVSAVTGVEPPSGLDGNKWLNALRRIARKRPYLWRNHREAVAEGYLEAENSAAVSFPTGAGKSTLSELRIYATLLREKKVVFLAPTNALVGQTTIGLRKTFRRTKVEQERFDEIGFLSEEDNLPEIFVMTPESCLAQMSIEPAVFADVGLLIFDECHLLHPEEGRGRRALDAMLCLLNFAGLVPGASFLLLSAMMKNTDEIAGWIQEMTGRTCLSLELPWKPTRQLRGSVVYPQSDVDKLSDGLVKAARARKTKAPSTKDKEKLKSVPMGLFSLKQTWATRDTEDYTLLGLLDEAINLAASKWWELTPNFWVGLI